MSTQYDQEAEVEQLRRWWRENWLPVVAGLALGLAAIYSWQAWTKHRDRKDAEASHIFSDLGTAADANKYADAAGMADRLAKDFDDTPYAADAALRIARLAVESDKLDDARARLEWAAAHGRDAGVRAIARLHLARVLLAQGKKDEAMKQLDGDAGTFGPLFDEERGDIQLAQGNRAGARAAYQKALQAQPSDSKSRDGLQRKIDDLADVADRS